MSEPYGSNWEYLQAELSHLNLLVRREVARWRELCHREQQDLFRGMYISDDEVEHLLRDASRPAAGSAREEEAASLDEITRRRRATLEDGVHLPLAVLAHNFSLTAAEEQVVLMCLAPELDQRYEKFYAYLQDDTSRKRPTVGLLLKLLGAEGPAAVAARLMFTPRAPLLRAHLLGFESGDGHLLSRGLKLDQRIVSFVLGLPTLGRRMSACLRLAGPSPSLDALRWPDEQKARLLAFLEGHLGGRSEPSRRLIVNLHGPAGTGRKALATALCAALNVPLMIIDLREATLRYQDQERALPRLFREAVLQPAAVYVEHVDRLLGEEEPAETHRRLLARCIEEFSWLTFVGTENAWQPNDLFRGHTYVCFELPRPDAEARAALWAELAAVGTPPLPATSWDELAVKFSLTPGQMRDALAAARAAALLRGGGEAAVSESELYRGCYGQSNQRLHATARKLTPRHCWDDLVLPPDGLAQLREACAQLRLRRRVYGEWGFERKTTLSKGLCVLFHGQSGTGKTMAVEVIANELQLEAYKIDLSSVVSKYIGETEKNLSAIFREAETSNAILFFDEADALFGKRSEVKDAHDRYANIEINYLLQRMEEFAGLVILATNLRKNIDEAFFRRMHFAVEFPFPDEERRYRIWRQHIPEAAPLADDVDFNFLASRLDVAGGHIKNIVVNAAFLAAANSGVINMKHLVQAARREYAKMGRLCTEAEFSPYHPLLRDHATEEAGHP